VRHATERWADEDAAAAVTDRTLVARTIARTALLQHRARRHALPVPAATGGEVPFRVQALLAPTPRPRPIVSAILAGLAATTVLATAVVQHGSETLFENAGASASHQQAQR
jgi:hypothetical protein